MSKWSDTHYPCSSKSIQRRYKNLQVK